MEVRNWIVSPLMLWYWSCWVVLQHVDYQLYKVLMIIAKWLERMVKQPHCQWTFTAFL